VTTGNRIESLAVLPFENLTGDPQQQYFVDGMYEALISDLASIHALRVVSRTSVVRYRDTNKSLPEIAGELNVDAVIEGSVFRSDEHVRITALLVDAGSDRQLWASSYEGDMRDILRLQRTTAQAIVNEIKVSLTSEERDRLATAQSLDPQAYEAYLRGRQSLNERIVGLERGIEFFERSLGEDPNFALAHAGLAECYALQAAWGIRDGREVFPKAKVAASRALQIDPALADAHLFLAFVLSSFDFDWIAAEAEYRRALELSPNSPWAHHYFGYFFVSMGRYDEALSELRLATQLDPFSLNIEAHLGEAFRYARRFDESVDWLERLLAKDGEYGLTRLFLGDAYIGKDRYSEAVSQYQAAVRVSNGSSYARAALAAAYALNGQRTEAREVLKELEAEHTSKYVSPFRIALIHLALNEKERALDWLDTAFQERNEITYLRAEPMLEPLRADSRFQELVRRVGLPSN
jgi:TolB-like protein/Tfp pilus assembly protein PilF